MIAAPICVAVALLTYAGSDALIWGHIFEAHSMWWADPQYQAGHKAILWGLLALGAVALAGCGLRWSAWYAVTFYALSQGGGADLLYYWLDGRAVPAALPWLDAPGHWLIAHPATPGRLMVQCVVGGLAAAWTARHLDGAPGSRRVAIHGAEHAPHPNGQTCG